MWPTTSSVPVGRVRLPRGSMFCKPCSMSEKWTNPESMFRHKPVGSPQSEDDFGSCVDAMVAARPAANSEFVRSVAAGVASIEAVRVFAQDLRAIAKDLPLIQGEIASRAALHGVDTVILLSHGATLAFGYQSHPPLVDLADRFANAVGVVDPPGWEPTLATTAYLVCVRSLGLEWMEAGITTMLVDRDWADAAAALASGLRDHYGISVDDLACLSALADFSGPRTRAVPALLSEIARSAYHQKLVLHALRETVTLWTNLWDSWASDSDVIPATSPGVVNAY